MRLGGVEPPTPALGGPRSIHLSYRRKFTKKPGRNNQDTRHKIQKIINNQYLKTPNIWLLKYWKMVIFCPAKGEVPAAGWNFFYLVSWLFLENLQFRYASSAFKYATGASYPINTASSKYSIAFW